MDKKSIEDAVRLGLAVPVTVDRKSKSVGPLRREGCCLLGAGETPDYYAFSRGDYHNLLDILHVGGLGSSWEDVRDTPIKDGAFRTYGGQHGEPFGYLRRVPCYADARGQILGLSYLVVRKV